MNRYNTSGNRGMGKDDIPGLVSVLFHPSIYLLPIQCPYLLCNNSTMAAYDSTSTNVAGYQLPKPLPLTTNTLISTWYAISCVPCSLGLLGGFDQSRSG